MSATRILVVEDELIVAADVEARLTRLGYEVAGPADSAADAIRLAGELRPDLVLMDIRLRGEPDGVAAAEEIRRRFRLPVVYLTAHADDATLQRAKVTEPFGYVLKPFEERELRTVIEMALYKHAADRRLAAGERRYAATLAGIADAVIATDAGGRVTFLNPAAEALTGWTAADAAGRPAGEVFRVADEETRRPVPDPVAAVLRTGEAVGPSERTLLFTRDGREVPVEDSAAPIHDDSGACAGVVLVFRDVSEKRRMEAERRQAQKMEAVGHLAGGVAHDFNNLLTVINGYCSLLLESVGADHPWHGLVAEVAKAGERAAGLTRQLLAFARKQFLQPKVIDLNNAVAGTEKLLRRLITENVELSADLHPKPLLAKADPGQVEQVIVNLAINARDAMPAGGRLRLTTAPRQLARGELAELPPGAYAQLTVSDNGCGMDAATRARVFEPFFTTKEVGKGTGLGLATVYGIVKQSGGHIGVWSEPGRGTTFTILLPLTQEAAIDVKPPAADLPRGAETVLLVEDDESVRGLSARLLRMAGYTVLEAGHGVEAVELAARYSEHIHLLVTDVVMPRMSGRVLADVLAAQRPGLRVLFVTGYTEEGSLCRDAGGHPVLLLTKPFAPEELARKVREALDEGRGGPRAAHTNGRHG